MRLETRTGPNLETMLAVDPTLGELPRPVEYGAHRMPELAAALTAIDEKNLTVVAV